MIKFNQHQETVDKKFAALEALIRKSEKRQANEVISAFNTGRSFASKHSSNKQSVKIQDNVPEIRQSKMKLDSGESARQNHQGRAMFELAADNLVSQTPSLSPPREQSAQKRRIISDVASNSGSQRNILQNVQSQHSLDQMASEHNLHAYASMGNIQTLGPVEDINLNQMSPSKRGAAALEGSPMFTPLEVKFKNMSKFEDSAKKIMDNHKYPTIKLNNDGARIHPITVEQLDNSNPSTQRRDTY